MPKRQININLDIVRRDKFLKFKVKQFDNIILNINCFKNGVPYEIPNSIINLYVGCFNEVFKQDKNITVKGSNILIDVDKNILSKAGVAYGEIELIDEQGQITTSTFIFNIGKKIGEGATIPGEIEGFIERYEKIVSEFKKTMSNIQTDYNILKAEIKNIVNDIEADYNDLSNVIKNNIKEYENDYSDLRNNIETDCNDLKNIIETNIKEYESDYSDLKTEFKDVINDIETDYNSLKKVIIDENASADLQNQINKLADGSNVRIVKSEKERDDIDVKELKNGVLCYVISTDKYYKYKDGEWDIFSSGTGGGGTGSFSAYISTTLPEDVMVNIGEYFNLIVDFSSPNVGKGTLKVFINDVDSLSTSIYQEENIIKIPHDLLSKGTNRIVVYALDRKGLMSNSLTFYVRYGGMEISSDFNPYIPYDYKSSIRYYFMPTALDTSSALTFYMKIDGVVRKGVPCTSDIRGYYTFPSNLSADSHYCEAWIEDNNGQKSNVLTFNLIILGTNTLVVASDIKSITVEEGEQISLDYKAYMKNNSSFITKTYVDNNLVNIGSCGLDTNYYKTSSLTEGIHTIKLEVWDVTETYHDYVTWTITVTPGTYEMLQPINAGAMFIGSAVNKTNTDERKQYFIGQDQEGSEVLGTLTNFAYNSESGWVNDELIISGNSHVEIPIQPLANNARYGFTLDIEFTSKQIGVEDAEVLTLWNDETNCGIKITTEKLILQSSNGDKCDLYFTDNERTHVMFIIDRQELKAKIYLNGVMCEAFHLNDYIVDGVAYLDDFTVNSNIVLGGLNKNGYCKIRNLRVYQVALTTDEILNNWMSCEIDKSKQRELVEFQKGNDLPTLTVYCDFSGLGKNDKKPCKIVYNSTDEVKYGKSFTLDHKQSQLQYQGTSSMAYPIKNYRLNLRNEDGSKLYYELPGSQPECRFTLKADFMNSCHAHNTGMAKFINDNLYNYNLKDEKSMNPFKWHHVQNGGNVNDFREAINGFPCRLILVNDGETPLNTGQNEPTPGNTKDMGIFNFNNDKDNVTTLGFNSDIFPNCASYEVTANSDTSAGAFMKFQRVYSIGSNTSETKMQYACTNSLLRPENIPLPWKIKCLNFYGRLVYNRIQTKDGINLEMGEITVIDSIPWDCAAVYLRSNTSDGENCRFEINGNLYVADIGMLDEIIEKTTDADELAYLKESFELRCPDADDVAEDWGFMGVGEEGTGLKALIDWVDNCTDEEFVRDFEQHFHKDYTLRYYALVVLIGAVDNLGKNMMLDTADNKIFFPRFYDIDTILSYDNSGDIKFDVDIEMEQGYWNTSSSRLWTRIRDLFHEDIVATYNNMRQNGVSYENIMKYMYDEQIAKIPQAYYNKDYDIKYAPFKDQYIGMAHGNGYEHMKRWLKNRFIFCDTLFDYAPSYNNDVLTIRANTTELMNIEIETYTPVYQHVSWYNGQMDKKKIDGKVSTAFSGTAMASTDQEVLIYGGSNVKRIKGISSMNPNQMLIGSATRLIELDASNCPLLADINSNKTNLSPHTYLNKVNLSNCPQLGGNLRLNNSPLIQEVDMRGTNITGLNLPSSIRNLQVLRLPNTITELTLNDAGMLHTLDFDEGVNLQSVSMTNCNALENVTGLDLLQTPRITLNNSYNNVAELYFKDTTNLSLSNMSNLERVIFTPNNEYETFELINVTNAPDYRVATFNCPKLSTFMTTAPYRESYNNVSGYVDKEIEVLGYVILTENYSPKGVSFVYDNIFTDFENGGYIEVEVDLSTCVNNLENIISFGTGIDKWSGSSKQIHMHYNMQSANMGVYDAINNKSINIPVTKIVIIRLDVSGVYINGTKCCENSLIGLNSISIGSQEGNVRSNAFYNYIKYYGYHSAIVQAKDYGDIQPNTTFTANSIDISSTQFTDVKLLCTTDTNTLKLPTTVKNFYCDSSFDLDTDYLEDGEYDVVHGELVEPYTTDYEGEVVRIQNVRMTLITAEGNLGENIIDKENISSTGQIGVHSSWIRTDYTPCYPNTPLSVECKNMAGSIEVCFYTKDKSLIEYNGTLSGSNSITSPPNTSYVIVSMRKDLGNSRPAELLLSKPYTPNLIPSSADGSLIFSMYVPSNTVAPASGTWDLKGLKFDNFHTFGMNNDVKQDSEGNITMPSRYDDYNITIKNANISPTTHNTMLYPLLVNEENPIEGRLDYTNYTGNNLSWAYAYTNLDKVDIIADNDLSNVEYLYNLAIESDLNIDTLINILNTLPQVNSEILNIGSTNLAKLTEDQIAIATNKGWTVA